MCIGWCTNQVTLRNARCNYKDHFRVVTAGYAGGNTKYWRTFATLYCEQPTVTEVMMVSIELLLYGNTCGVNLVLGPKALGGDDGSA